MENQAKIPVQINELYWDLRYEDAKGRIIIKRY